MLTEQQIMAEFEAAEAILKGHFILSSGLHSEMYLQCARVLMDARRADRLCKTLADKLKQWMKDSGQTIDIIVAPAMGGVVVGYEMGRQLGKPLAGARLDIGADDQLVDDGGGLVVRTCCIRLRA